MLNSVVGGPILLEGVDANLSRFGNIGVKNLPEMTKEQKYHYAHMSRVCRIV